MARVRDELVATKREKEKVEKTKATVSKLKKSTSSAEAAAVPSVPEEKYCKLEGDYDNALQEIEVSCVHAYPSFCVFQAMNIYCRHFDSN